MLKQYMSSTHMQSRADWNACIVQAAEMGFDGIELFGGDYALREKMEPARLSALRRAAAAHGIALSAHPWVEWAALPPEALVSGTQWLLENCARLGAREVNVHMAFFTDRGAGLERLFDAFDPCLPLLEAEGMTLLFENVPGHGLREIGSEPDDFASLFSHYGPDAPVMMTMDNGHAHIMGCTREMAERFAGRWRYAHIDDNDGLEDLHLRPGEGNVDWDDLADCARRAGYAGPLMMEYPQAGLEEGLAVVRRAFEGAGYALRTLKTGA